MPTIRVYVRKKIQLGSMNPQQREMFKITTVATASVKDRQSKAITPEGTPAKPLSKPWAIKKQKLRGVFSGNPKSNKRDLIYTGQMMRDFQVRTVSETKGQARNSTVRGRQKARENERRQQWAAFSRRNIQDTVKAAYQILPSIVGRIIKGIGFQKVRGAKGLERYKF